MKLLLKIVLPAAMIAAGVFGFLELKASRPEPRAIEAPERQWAVTAATVERGNHRPLARLYGRIESPSMSTLSAAVSAEVREVEGHEGDLVRAGQLLVRLDDRDLRLLLRQRESELRELEAKIASEEIYFASDRKALEDELALLKLAERNLSRAERLANTSAGSQADVDEALQALRGRSLAVTQRRRLIEDHGARRAALEAGVSRVESLRARVERDLERTGIRAPFDGRIASIRVSPGERVRVGDPLVEVFDIARLEIRAQLPEKYLVGVRRALGDGATLDGVADVHGRQVAVALDRFAGAIRQGQGGLDGFFRFVDGDGARALEVGRVIPVRLSLPRMPDAVSLPVTALYGSNTVYRVVAGRLQNVEVEYVGEHLGANGERRVLVASPALNRGDLVATTQIPAAVDGLKVQVIEP